MIHTITLPDWTNNPQLIDAVPDVVVKACQLVTSLQAIRRFGIDQYNPLSCTTNTQDVIQQVGELLVSIESMGISDVLLFECMEQIRKRNKLDKKKAP